MLGGSGFVGRHVARRLADNGWDVTIGSRSRTPLPAEVVDLKHATVDRSHGGSLEKVVAGVDVLVDVISYELADAEQLVTLKDAVGSLVAISTVSVYADDAGRTLDEATSEDDFPQVAVPIPEDHPRTKPGDGTYSTRKVAIEDLLMEQDDLVTTVIRPCAIYGPGDTQSREWFFVKRILDGRPFVLLADEGQSVFHTTSVHNVAELVRLAAERPTSGAFNCGDPDPPNVRRIASSIAEAMDHEWREVLLPRSKSLDPRLRNPWGVYSPWIVAMDKARQELGYQPVTTYEDSIAEAVQWVINATEGRDWKKVLPKAAKYLADDFDYAAENEFFQALG